MASHPPLDRTHHLALYRRFRAQTFAQIVGQPAVVETLRNAVRLDRLGHGFLFVGPRGTGKTSMARILAKAANCPNLVDGEPCDACPSCDAIREGRALDVVEMDAASNNKVDDMRELVPRVHTTPSDLRRKVFIIDEVQRIKEGWDVLLKTLEEPPDHVLFIFCTTDPSQIRPAVVSRLQRFSFRPLRVEEIAGKLERILTSEGRTADPDAVQLVARLAAGGMRDAEGILDQVLNAAADPLTAASVRDLIGMADADAVDAFIAALATGDALAGITLLDRLDAEGRDATSFADQVIARVRELLVLRLSGRPVEGRVRDVSSEGLARIGRRLSALDVTRTTIGGYRFQLELALLEASTAVRAVPVAAAADAHAAPAPSARTPEVEAAPAAVPLRPPAPADASVRPERPAASHRDAAQAQGSPRGERVAATAERTSSPGRPASQPEPATAGGQAIEQLRAGWPEVVRVVGSNPAYRPLVDACRPIEVREGVVVLGFPEDKAFLRDRAEQKRAVFEEGIRQVMGRPYGVRCVTANVEATPTGGDDATIDLVEHARRIFGGELADVAEIS